MRFRLIDAAKKDFPVQRLCKVLDVSASGYLAWKERPACRRQRDDMVLLAHVRSAFTLSNGTYGSPRMVHELRDNGLTIGRRRVARPMRRMGSGLGRSGGSSAPPTAFTPFRLPRTFWTRTSQRPGRTRSRAPNRLRVDPRGLADLAVVIDLFARRVVGWERVIGFTRTWHRRLCAGPSPCGYGCPPHSPRGPRQPIRLLDYQAELRKNGILISMSGKGNCFDNAMVETLSRR